MALGIVTCSPNFRPEPKLVYNIPTNGGLDHEKAIYGGTDRCDFARGATCPDPKIGDTQKNKENKGVR